MRPDDAPLLGDIALNPHFRQNGEALLRSRSNGADDYLTKPFAPRELVARVRAHLRPVQEYRTASAAPNQISFGSLMVDVDIRDAFHEGKPTRLTEREFELLHFLAGHRDKALATDWIFESAWGYDADMGVKTLAVYVRRLRRKISDCH